METPPAANPPERLERRLGLFRLELSRAKRRRMGLFRRPRRGILPPAGRRVRAVRRRPPRPVHLQRVDVRRYSRMAVRQKGRASALVRSALSLLLRQMVGQNRAHHRQISAWPRGHDHSGAGRKRIRPSGRSSGGGLHPPSARRTARARRDRAADQLRQLYPIRPHTAPRLGGRESMRQFRRRRTARAPARPLSSARQAALRHRILDRRVRLVGQRQKRGL